MCEFLTIAENGEGETKGHIRKLTFDSTDKKETLENTANSESNAEVKNPGL